MSAVPNSKESIEDFWRKNKENIIGICLVFGAGMGVAVGMAIGVVTDNIVLGIAFGVSIGGGSRAGNRRRNFRCIVGSRNGVRKLATIETHCELPGLALLVTLVVTLWGRKGWHNRRAAYELEHDQGP